MELLDTTTQSLDEKEVEPPNLVEALGRVATDSNATVTNRFEAIELLLRLAIGPRTRPADAVDVVASQKARIALSEAASFLDQIMVSNNRARILLHAASLASLI